VGVVGTASLNARRSRRATVRIVGKMLVESHREFMHFEKLIENLWFSLPRATA
jgi:ABC-type transporter Mla maintaining outer membrane lipid asymmetry permease subunit MlaE